MLSSGVHSEGNFGMVLGAPAGVTDEVPTGRRDFRREESYLNNKSNLLITDDGLGSGSGQKLITNVNTGLVEDEQNGLFLEDRKRRRSDEEGNAIKDKDALDHNIHVSLRFAWSSWRYFVQKLLVSTIGG
ncbi:hypothetical protein POM88_036591 [Heracleum sosnowskyi]|uniref:Uncharacterized protein n=1 Tax=Heracleum sosnowskyi TaxID=360622 RepID=A0AAD8HQ22_9APIA|nr:hypothetical protein POM88_036591 [Heracleum sosnowskyi]